MNRIRTSAFILAAAATAAGVAACSGASSTSPPTAAFTPLPVLVAGTTSTYSGTYSEVITYASPSAKQPNSTAAYKVSDVQTVSAAPTGAPAPFDVHRQLAYTATTVPTSGIQLQKRTIDSYESSTVTKTSQTIAQPSLTTLTSGIDQTANRVAGNGPYAYNDTTTTTYATPRVLFLYPLVAGTATEPLARTVANNEKSANGSGTVYSARNTTSTFGNDGSFVESGSIGTNETTNVTENSNGTATVVNTGATPSSVTIGLPVAGSGGAFEIPITRVTGSESKSYLAADWYPGGASPPSPLALTTQIVKGPSSIPSSCGVTVAAPNPQEVDTSSTTVNVVSGSYTQGTTQTFVSNGATVCRITTSTAQNYAIDTGLLTSTTVDTFTEGLTAQSAAAGFRRQP